MRSTPVVGNEHLDILADDLAGRIAKDLLGAGIEVRHNAAPVSHDDAVAGRGQNGRHARVPPEPFRRCTAGQLPGDDDRDDRCREYRDEDPVGESPDDVGLRWQSP